MSTRIRAQATTRVGAVRVELDVTAEALALLFGVSRMTVHRWEDPDSEHAPQALQAVVLACLEAGVRGGQVTVLRQIVAAAEHDLGGALWQLLNLKEAA